MRDKLFYNEYVLGVKKSRKIVKIFHSRFFLRKKRFANCVCETMRLTALE